MQYFLKRPTFIASVLALLCIALSGLARVEAQSQTPSTGCQASYSTNQTFCIDYCYPDGCITFATGPNVPLAGSAGYWVYGQTGYSLADYTSASAAMQALSQQATNHPLYADTNQSGLITQVACTNGNSIATASYYTTSNTTSTSPTSSSSKEVSNTSGAGTHGAGTSGNGSECTADQVLSYGVCISCPAPLIVQNGQCVLNGGFQNHQTTAACPDGYVSQRGVCVASATSCTPE